MSRPTNAFLLSALVLLCGCSDSASPTAPTSERLSAQISPNPLSAPTAPGDDVLWDVVLRANSSGSVVLDLGDAQLLSATGAKVGHTRELWIPTANCPTCTPEVRIAAGTSQRWSGKRVRYVGGEAPVKLVYTLTYLNDGGGTGSITVEVPVH
jgi:hypothetical protein